MQYMGGVDYRTMHIVDSEFNTSPYYVILYQEKKRIAFFEDHRNDPSPPLKRSSICYITTNSTRQNITNPSKSTTKLCQLTTHNPWRLRVSVPEKNHPLFQQGGVVSQQINVCVRGIYILVAPGRCGAPLPSHASALELFRGFVGSF